MLTGVQVDANVLVEESRFVRVYWHNVEGRLHGLETCESADECVVGRADLGF